ncbi:MAG TPA: LytTR family DNA-binding domain-containing protein [Phenylobacterium sp.]|jgi:hypothetical protein|nr:LytTR family DNA-binding domain-containing protein [Phenylobacterium sp.]
MTDALRTAAIDPRQRVRHALRDLSLGFFYWLGFVLVLEPGNLLRWTPPDLAGWTHEVLRLAGAGVLGGAATPFILALTRRLPIEGPSAIRRGAIHLAFCAGMALALVVASCLLAKVLPGAAHEPLAQAIAEELVANGLLVTACIAGLTVLAHAVRAVRGETPSAYAEGMTVRQRGHLERIDLAQVDWIESQGNYLALHSRSGTRLVRQTAKTFEAGLDPRRFVRIHRRAIVALDAVQTVTPLAAGDASVRLKTGEALRVSRSRRQRLWTALESLETS